MTEQEQVQATAPEPKAEDETKAWLAVNRQVRASDDNWLVFLESAIRRIDTDIAEANQKLATMCDNLVSEERGVVGGVTREVSDSVASVAARFKDEMNRAKARFDSIVKAATKEYDTIVSQLRKDQSRELARHEAELKNRVDPIQAQYEAKRSELKKIHAEDIRRVVTRRSCCVDELQALRAETRRKESRRTKGGGDGAKAPQPPNVAGAATGLALASMAGVKLPAVE